MIPSFNFTAVLDACVLFPAPIRDLILHTAAFDLYKPKWTGQIQEEWRRNLLKKRPDLMASGLQRTTEEMNKAFPDANVENYEVFLSSLKLPDADDRHVLAAALRCKADVIVTYNLKDFPNEYLVQFDLEAQHPDYFISNLIDLHPEKALEAFRKQVASLKNPPKTETQVLESLRKCGLESACDKISAFLLP
jgi:hypothetical protein